MLGYWVVFGSRDLVYFAESYNYMLCFCIFTDEGAWPYTSQTLIFYQSLASVILLVAWSHLRSKGKVCHYLP